jgi:cytochrome P450
MIMKLILPLTASSGPLRSRTAAHMFGARVQLARSAFTPFSIGPRSCLGKGLALTELSLTMAYLYDQDDTRTAADSTRHYDGQHKCKYQHHSREELHDETLRMSPPASSSLWREVIQDGVMIDGHVIPRG